MTGLHRAARHKRRWRRRSTHVEEGWSCRWAFYALVLVLLLACVVARVGLETFDLILSGIVVCATLVVVFFMCCVWPQEDLEEERAIEL